MIAAAFGISVSAFSTTACSSNTSKSVSVSQDYEKEKEEVRQLANVNKMGSYSEVCYEN